MRPTNELKAILSAPQQQRAGMPISVVERGGVVHVLSRYGDAEIDLSPYLENPANEARGIPVSRFPVAWRDTALNVLLAYWYYGRDGEGLPKASTVVTKATHLCAFVGWAARHGLRTFSEVKPIHVREFAEQFRSKTFDKKASRRRTPGTVAAYLNAVSLVWDLREHLADALTEPPFGERGEIGRFAGRSAEPLSLSTDPLSMQNAAIIYQECMKLIGEAEASLVLLSEVDALRATLAPDTDKRTFDHYRADALPHLTGKMRHLRTSITNGRGACMCLISLLGGLRIHEILLLEVDCYFETTRDGEVLGWLKGATLKGRKDGQPKYAEWIVPRESLNKSPQ